MVIVSAKALSDASASIFRQRPFQRQFKAARRPGLRCCAYRTRDKVIVDNRCAIFQTMVMRLSREEQFDFTHV